jgi:hypothetical protein
MPQLVPFKVTINGPPGHYDIVCVEGCQEGAADVAGESGPDEFAFGIFQDRKSMHIGGPDGPIPNQVDGLTREPDQ